MKRIYSVLMLATMMVMTSLNVGAQTMRPVAPGGDVLTAGKTYTYFSYSKLAGQMIRTSWDGAIYSPNGSTSPFSVKLTAQENSDGTWSFYYDDEVTTTIDDVTTTETVRYYMNIPEGSGNVNVNATEQCDWTVKPGHYDGFYFVLPGAGNNAQTLGYNMHMNAGNEYVVASYYGNSWYPDFCGGVLKDEYGDNVYISDDPEENRVVMADSSSCNWAFVEVDNVPAFLEKASVFATLNGFYDTWLNGDAPLGGMILSYNAAMAIYNGGDVDAEGIESLTEILNAKVALYNALHELEYDDDVQTALAKEIEEANEAFDTEYLDDKVTAATEKLKKAVAEFKAGIGDMTAMGQNMSFEDLSAQDGATTTSVQGAPAGWNVYINGKQAVTASDVRSAGFNAWHGQNADGTGAKDGEYIFGIWNSSIPEYEISQTIEGLEPGTYTITAALMVGANGSGSRRTTQRIFGNYNSTYFGYEDDYNPEELDMTEVYGFQGNEEPQTDTELQPIEVKAYVYDGTLTFGVRTDGSELAAANRTDRNGAGGDGWFKVDDFRIHKDGYNVDDAMAILKFFRDGLSVIVSESSIKMFTDVRENALSLLSSVNEVSPTDNPSNINGAIKSLHYTIGEVQAAVNTYERLQDAIYDAYENLAKYDSKAGAGEYADVIMEVEELYENEEYTTEEEIDAAIQQLADALQACKESDTIEAGSELTEYLKNPSFEDWSMQTNDNSGTTEHAPAGWGLIVNGQEVQTADEIRAAGFSSWMAINHGDNIDVEFEGEMYTHQYTDGDHLWGVWADNVPTVELYQELMLPAGIYHLSADVVVQHDWGGMNITTQRLFGNESVQMYGRDYDYGENFTEDMYYAQALQEYNTNDDIQYFSYAGYDNDVSYDYTSLARPMSLNFRVGEDGKARIGFRTNNIDATGTEHPHACAGWFKLDNFRLECVSIGLFDIPELPEGINEVQNAANVGAIYDLTGRRVTTPTKGVYIQNGVKFMVK
ncbi:MAG: hypothetical protein IJT28_03650 [Bacteroidaceae bacterium]|nr:hypothetical protein [Bacteroidaceae bacterium]